MCVGEDKTMSKELKRLKDWLNGYEAGFYDEINPQEIFNDINIFIDALIHDYDVEQHEAKKAALEYNNRENPPLHSIIQNRENIF